MTQEIWKTIPGFDGYEVSSEGQVRSLKRRQVRMLRPALSDRGYLLISTSTGSKKLHQLVCMAFYGPRPEGMQVRHLDGNKLNNCAANLRWGTREENLADLRLHGSMRRGAESGRAKLTEEQVLAIREMSGTTRAIGAMFGVSNRQVSSIKLRQSWAHL